MLLSGINFLLASDPTFVGNYSVQILDFLIGANCGVFAVTLIEYLRGFFLVEAQEESQFIHISAICLNIIGVIAWTFVCYILMLIVREIMLRREKA